MSDRITRTDTPRRTDAIGPVAPLPSGDARREDRAPVDGVAGRPTERFDGVPATPPQEVLDEVAQAMDRLDDLRAEGLALRFDVPDEGGVQIAVVGEDGEVRRDVGAAEALEIALGERPALPPERADDPDERPRLDREA